MRVWGDCTIIPQKRGGGFPNAVLPPCSYILHFQQPYPLPLAKKKNIINVKQKLKINSHP